MERGAEERSRWKRRLVWVALLVLSLSAMLAAAGPALADQAVYFDDVLPNHPYYDAVNGLYVAGVIDGYSTPQGGKNFRPTASVLRAQFAKMILGALKIPVTESEWQDSSPPFTDFEADDPGNLYPHDYVAAAFRLGITKGATATTFAPFVDIKRIQLISMVVRAAKAAKPGAVMDPPSSYSGELSAYYSDPNHGQNVRIAEYNGLLDGLVGFGPNWDADAKATRGEAAQIMWNLYSAEDSGLLFYDDFSDPKSGWTLVSDNEDYKCGYQPREDPWYSISIFVPDWAAMAWRPESSYDDFEVDANAGCVAADPPGEFGLLFRMQDGTNFYCFSVSNQGYWRLRKMVSGTWQAILASTYSDAIATGDHWNYLGVVCSGPNITLSVNDTEVGQVSDSTFASGWVGLMGGSFETGDVQMVFDDLAVWSLADAPSATEEEFFKVSSLGVAYNGASSPTFTLSDTWKVTELLTYHWNQGQGMTPGTIGLRAANGTMYGPWQATGLPGQGGVANANWVVHPDVIIPPGTYSVIDSSPSTWSQNSETGGRGMGWGKGIRQIPL